jgi:hypothetical protein
MGYLQYCQISQKLKFQNWIPVIRRRNKSLFDGVHGNPAEQIHFCACFVVGAAASNF